MLSTESLKTVLIILLIGCTLTLARAFWYADTKAFSMRQRFEHARGELEALNRTKGWRINSAYRCYHREYVGRIEK